MDEALLSISPVGCGQLVKTLIATEPHGILRSNLAYIFVLTLSSHWYTLVNVYFDLVVFTRIAGTS